MRAAAGPKFKYWQSTKNQQWYFRLVAVNGETIAQSEGYTTEESCKKGIAAVKASTEAVVEKMTLPLT